MTGVELVAVGLGLGFLAMALYLASNVVRTWGWLQRRRVVMEVPRAGAPTIVLLVPVLREQAVIEQTLRHLAAMPYPRGRLRVAAITTAREDRERREALERLDDVRRWLAAGVAPGEVARRLPGLGPASLVVPVLREHGPKRHGLRAALEELPSTADIVDGIVADERHGTIRRIHYPFSRGHMAHQVNWGARYLFEVVDHGIDPAATWIGLYNADSRPHVDTLAHVSQAIERAGGATGSAVAFQQHSLYRTPAEAEGWLPHAAAAWQSRWSLAVEHPRARRGTARLDAHRDSGREVASWTIALRCPFNYAIGHGLFVRLRELVRLNYLPEHSVNEDAPFGYLLTLAGLALRPVPVFDDADVPTGWRGLLAQQGGWFRGPLDASRYRVLARRQRVTRLGPVLPWTLAWRVRWDALAWIAGPYAALAVACAFALAPGLPTGFALACVGVYLVLPTGFTLWLAPWPREGRQLRTAPALFAAPLFYLLHGLGPTLHLARRAIGRLRGAPPAKYKTER